MSVVLLGDACTGKSALARALTGGSFTKTYTATMGADILNATVSSQLGQREVVIYDYSGSERFLSPAHNSPLIQADACVLVVDCTSRKSLEHLDQWHDEYLQCGFRGGAPPCFVVVLTKLDRAHEREVTYEEVVGWSSQEAHDPTLWPKAVVQGLLPAPPVIELSAADGRGLPTLNSTLAERLTTRDRLVTALQHPVPQFEVFRPASGLRLVMFGDAERAKDIMVAAAVGGYDLGTENLPPPVETIERDEGTHALVDTGSNTVDVWLAPSIPRGAALTYCRGAHVCVLTLKLGIRPMLHRVHFWNELFRREACLRGTTSVLWVLLGWRTSDYIAESSAEAAAFAGAHGMHFIELPEEPTPEFVARCWSIVAEAAVAHRNNIIFERTTAQLNAFAQQYGESVYVRSPSCSMDDDADSSSVVGAGESRGGREGMAVQQQDGWGSFSGAHLQHARRPSVLPASQRIDAVETKVTALHNMLLSRDADLLRHVRTQAEEVQQHISSLESELKATQAALGQQTELVADMRIEMRLLWEEVEALRKDRREQL